MKTKTFTLIELILVVAIIALLAGAMVPMILSARQKARISKILQTVDAAKAACTLFYSDTGTFGGTTSLNPAPANNNLVFDDGTPGWNGPYIDRRIIADDNPFGSIIMVSNSYPCVFDFDGDNVADKAAFLRGNVFGFECPSAAVAQEIDQKIDSNVPGLWTIKGRVQYRQNAWMGMRWFVYIAIYDPNI